MTDPNSDDSSTKADSSNPFEGLLALTDAAASRLEKAPSKAEKAEPKETEEKDSSQPPNPEIHLDTIPKSGTTKSIASSLSKKKESFAISLMELLMGEENSEVITFLPDNRHFVILDSKEFSLTLMPKAFGIHTYGSFVRKLLRWGFDRVKEKKKHDADVFFHPLFTKGDWRNCARIKCVGHLAHAPTTKRPYPSLGESLPSLASTRAALLNPTTQEQFLLLLQQQQQQQQQAAPPPDILPNPQDMFPMATSAARTTTTADLRRMIQRDFPSSLVSQEIAHLENVRRENEYWQRQQERLLEEQMLRERLLQLESQQRRSLTTAPAMGGMMTLPRPQQYQQQNSLRLSNGFPSSSSSSLYTNMLLQQQQQQEGFPSNSNGSTSASALAAQLRMNQYQF